MNNDYFNYQKCVDDLTAILSIGYFFKYSTEVIEKRISESKYFNNFNKDFFTSESYISTDEIIESIYFDADLDENTKNVTYNELEWVSMVYINIIEDTGLGFEAIFCYAPIEKVIMMYRLYHELDFSKCVEWFNEERNKASIIKVLMKRMNMSNEHVSSKTNISLSMVDALKNMSKKFADEIQDIESHLKNNTPIKTYGIDGLDKESYEKRTKYLGGMADSVREMITIINGCNDNLPINEVKEHIQKFFQRYYVAYTGPRTIVTMYGEITYTRTLYKDRLDGSYYCYVDEKMGISKYIRYTNDVACYAAEAYADENSMSKIGIEIGNLIHAKFSLKDNRDYAIPRQTIYNLMKRSKEIRIEPISEKKVIDDIYILTDEKYQYLYRDSQ